MTARDDPTTAVVDDVADVVHVESHRVETVYDERAAEGVIVESLDTETRYVDEPAAEGVIVEQYRRGPRGLRGEAGIPESERMYARRVDQFDETPGTESLYRAEAAPGTADDAPAWRVRRIDITGPDCDVRERWANGTADFVHRWTERATYDYR